MRTDKELVQLLLDNLDYAMSQELYNGLCSSINCLSWEDKIDYKERVRLHQVINNYILPYKFLSFNPLRKDCVGDYWWTGRKITPRKKFLKVVLKQLDNEK